MMQDHKPESPTPMFARRRLSGRQQWRMLKGKLHRFFVGHFDRIFVSRSLQRRKGECARCGACCQLMYRCTFAVECADGAGCRIYKRRPINCRIFPLHEKDLEERNMIMPEKKCGYYFE